MQNNHFRNFEHLNVLLLKFKMGKEIIIALNYEILPTKAFNSSHIAKESFRGVSYTLKCLFIMQW